MPTRIAALLRTEMGDPASGVGKPRD